MQTQPSLAIARALKQRQPETRIMFGGSNAFSEMGRSLIENFNCIDLVAHGEADLIIEPAVRALRGEPGFSLDALRGISFRRGGAVVDQSSGAADVVMDDIPLPDYDDYFRTVRMIERQSAQTLDLPQYLPVETARGCWWGEKSHCTFCGLNADRMRFRSKSPENAIAQFRELYQRYRVSNFFAVDNIIDHRYYDTVLRALAEQEQRFFIHYEIKANLKREQVQLLASSGVRKVQPGIESLSTPVLKIMRKGISASQNIQTLKWLTEFGLQTTWFLLYGFPGEELDHYKEIARLIPRLMHLTPPMELAPVYIERFSPYQTNPRAFGIQIEGPTQWYEMAFPNVPGEQLKRLAYRFDFAEPTRDAAINHFVERNLRALTSEWQARYQKYGCTLSMVHGPRDTVIICGPLQRPERLVRTGPLVSAILRQCESLCLERDILSRLDDSDEREVEDGAAALPVGAYQDFLKASSHLVVTPVQPDTSLHELLERLDAGGLLLRENGKLLSLPVNRTEFARTWWAGTRRKVAETVLFG
jgi:ribosomal peptide maturation radical SAM protein 1